ncbi:MAG TPA: thioredoxin family protein [Acidimicrobiales bacterium]|nr:thioredoxin family protein [Acidimicrobiales bacterium]
MNRLVAVVVVFALAGAVAWLLQRRKPAPPTQPTAYPVPTQLDRADFTRPDAPWLVVLFSSATCGGCEAMRSKTAVLAATDVAYQEVSYQTDKALHARYTIEAVPLVVIADADGVVVNSFVGEVSAIDLWGAVATARDPSSAPGPPEAHEPHHSS